MERKNSYDRVSPPWWDEVWIVGGGRSADRFDFSRLAGKPVVAITGTAARFFGEAPAAVFSIDEPWVSANMLALAYLPAWCECYVVVPIAACRAPGLRYLRPSCTETGLSTDDGYVVTGGNSGYGAINLAYLKGAREIHLVGYDMDSGEEKYRQWIPRFRTTVPQLEARGVRVVNHNLDSAIDAFQKEI